VPDNLAYDIRMYAAMVEDLPGYDDWMEVTNLLTWRDAIHDALPDGVALPSTQAALLARADAKLLKRRALIAERFPEVAERTASIPKDHWWWHLDQGPPAQAEAPATGPRGARSCRGVRPGTG
jgi:hypothetical protein